MLGDRDELDVGETVLLYILNKFFRQLAVRQARAPRTNVNFVDAHGPAERITIGPGGQPVLVVPFVSGIENDRRRRWRSLCQRRHRVGLAVPAAVLAADLVLVPGA